MAPKKSQSQDFVALFRFYLYFNNFTTFIKLEKIFFVFDLLNIGYILEGLWLYETAIYSVQFHLLDNFKSDPSLVKLSKEFFYQKLLKIVYYSQSALRSWKFRHQTKQEESS